MSQTYAGSDRKWQLPGQLRILMGIVLLTSSASALLAPILMIYLRDHVTGDLGQLAWAYLPAAIAGAVLPSRFGRLSDRYGRRPPMAVALLTGAAISLLIPGLRSLWPLAFLWVLEAAAFRGRHTCRRSAGGRYRRAPIAAGRLSVITRQRPAWAPW